MKVIKNKSENPKDGKPESKKEQKKEVKSFSINELNTISSWCSVLKTCDNVKPFSLSQRINKCQLLADAKLRELQGLLDAIGKHEIESEEEKQVSRDLVWADKYAIDLPVIAESEFEGLEIDGEKKIYSIDGKVKTFSYREAYFALLSLVIG